MGRTYILSSTYESHMILCEWKTVTHVQTVLLRLLAHELYAKAEKCEFHVCEISFLSYQIGPGGVVMDDRKVRAVVEWPEPTSVMELQMIRQYFRWLIKNFSTVAAPLTSLLKGKLKQLKVTPAAKVEFLRLTGAFTSTPVLKLPDPARPFMLPQKWAWEQCCPSVTRPALEKAHRCREKLRYCKM